MDSGRDDEGFLFVGKSFMGGGMGPVGLDFHRPYAPKQAHLDCCRSHVELAKLIGAGGPRWMDSVMEATTARMFGLGLAGEVG